MCLSHMALAMASGWWSIRNLFISYHSQYPVLCTILSVHLTVSSDCAFFADGFVFKHQDKIAVLLFENHSLSVLVVILSIELMQQHLHSPLPTQPCGHRYRTQGRGQDTL